VDQTERVTIDPASLQVLLARLAGVADEMSAVLRRAAYSPNIKERADCSAAVFTPAGELLAQAENIPVHLGSMPASVRAAIDRFDGGTALAPGDQVILNDPFAGGTHLNDITVVAPCFVRRPAEGSHDREMAVAGAGGDEAGGKETDGAPPGGVPPDAASGDEGCDFFGSGATRLVGWVATRAHHADVGGAAPGSLPADAVEVFEEGLRLPPLRLTDEVRAILLANSRTPIERAGDLDAQIGANTVGVARLARMAGQPFDEALAYGDRRMRAALDDLPRGTWRFEDVVDSFGPEVHQQVETVIRVALTVDGDGVTVDFTGTDEQRLGNVNAVEAVTVSAVAFALRSVLDPTIPANGGALRPLRVIAPEGTVVNARPPAAVGAGNVEVSQRVADVCLGALALARPGAVGAASQGTMNNVLIGGATGAGPNHDEAWVYYETVGGGQGGRWFSTGPAPVAVDMTDPVEARRRAGEPGPGQSGIHTNMTNTRNTPVEALERAFPLRVLRQRLRRGSGGAGRSRGGEGIERDLQVLTDATVSLITERRVSQPWGLAGGEPGAVGENWLLPGGDEARAKRLPDKCTIQLKAGDVLRMLTPGGGGWGPAP
jgi:N-methylhydantoinase B/oxoprolinase/acetone carboxylase alpha subunit